MCMHSVLSSGYSFCEMLVSELLRVQLVSTSPGELAVVLRHVTCRHNQVFPLVQAQGSSIC